MCTKCGVTPAMHDRALNLLAAHSWVKLYRNRGLDPAEMGVDDPSGSALVMIEDHLYTYAVTHRPGRAVSLAEQRAVWARRAEQRRNAWREGC